MKQLEIKKQFIGNGEVKILLEFTFKNDEFVTDALPPTCQRCPVGFLSQKDCGKRQPLDVIQRSPDCKLRTIEQYLGQYMRR